MRCRMDSDSLTDIYFSLVEDSDFYFQVGGLLATSGSLG